MLRYINTLIKIKVTENQRLLTHLTTWAAAFCNIGFQVLQHNLDLMPNESHMVWKVLKKTQLYRDQHFCPPGQTLYIPDPLSIHTFENGFTDLETTLRSNRKLFKNTRV